MRATVTAKLAVTIIALPLALIGSGTATATADDFILGVNGHPLTQVGYYDVPIEVQLQLLQELGARFYRVDIWEDLDFDRMDKLVAEAKKRGLEILPVFTPHASDPPREFKPEDLDAARESARDYAFKVVSRYRSEIRYWAILNEPDIRSMIREGEQMITGEVWTHPGAPDGSQTEHYHQLRYEWLRGWLTGLGEGVRAADPDAQRIVNNGGWLHYGFIQRLVDDEVPFEILAWHWYSEMGDLTNAGNVDLLSRLEKFGKPIWITEGNLRNGSFRRKEAEQASYLSQTIERMKSLYPRVQAYFIYELLDEPYFGENSPESHYGLFYMVRSDEQPIWRLAGPKPAVKAVAATVDR